MLGRSRLRAAGRGLPCHTHCPREPQVPQAGLACPITGACQGTPGEGGLASPPQAGRFWDLLAVWHPPACHVPPRRSWCMTGSGLAARSIRESRQVCSSSMRHVPPGEDAPPRPRSVLSPAQAAEVDIVSLCLRSFKLFFPGCFLSFSEESAPFAPSEWAVLRSQHHHTSASVPLPDWGWGSPGKTPLLGTLPCCPPCPACKLLPQVGSGPPGRYGVLQMPKKVFLASKLPHTSTARAVPLHTSGVSPNVPPSRGLPCFGAGQVPSTTADPQCDLWAWCSSVPQFPPWPGQGRTESVTRRYGDRGHTAYGERETHKPSPQPQPVLPTPALPGRARACRSTARAGRR